MCSLSANMVNAVPYCQCCRFSDLDGAAVDLTIVRPVAAAPPRRLAQVGLRHSSLESALVSRARVRAANKVKSVDPLSVRQLGAVAGDDLRHLLAESLRRPRDHDHLALQIHLTLRDCFNSRGYDRPRFRSSPFAYFMKM